jgi:hypothetical protein
MRLRLALLLAVALFVGCSSSDLGPAYKIVFNMPRIWEAPTLYVRLPEDVKAGDLSIEYATAMCKEFAIRLYDVFDGQAYVPKFIICNPSVVGERESGMCNLFKYGSLLYHNESYMGDPPLRPGRFYCNIPLSAATIDSFAGVMLHEWLHTFVGLGDEYKKAGVPGNTMTTSCPLDPNSAKNLEDNSCVMYLSRSRRELCRPENHNPDTDEGKESCYTKAARVLFENRLAFIRVPDHCIKGPFNPPTPIIEIRLK